MDSRVWSWVALAFLLVACVLPWGRISSESALTATGDSVESAAIVAGVPNDPTVSGFRGWLTVFGIRIPNVVVPVAALLAVIAFTVPMPADFRLHPWSAKGPVILSVVHAVQVAVVLHRAEDVVWPLYLALTALGWLMFLVMREPPYALRTHGSARRLR